MRILTPRSRSPARWTPALLVLLAAGCGRGPTVVGVSGVVTHKGKPVPSVVVNFEPDQGRPSWGATGRDGRFVLTCFAENDGALTGSHLVYVTPHDAGGEEARHRNQLVPRAEFEKILQKYGNRNTTPLRIEITKKTKDLEITLD
jgi:hypothetical protein